MFIGFDLGAKLGYAVLSMDGDRIASGTWSFGKRQPSSVQSLYDRLVVLATKYDVVLVGYEKVNFFHRGFKAAHAYGTYEAILWLVAQQFDWPLQSVPIQHIKKLATGFSNADKDEVEVAVYRRWNGYVSTDDNEADSLWCCEYVRRSYLGEIDGCI